ncbi:MAG TPA: hypothetical protein VJY83_10445 [Thiopseudomonas sp.]|nr:hypothetical protein [Thiopseudomonas sp.]
MSVEPNLTLPVVLLKHQGHYFALEAAYVRSQGSVLALDDQRSVVTFSALLDQVTCEHCVTEHYLELAGAGGSWRLGLEQSADLVELAIADISALPVSLQARRQFPALQALAWYQGQLVSLLDPKALQRLRVELA